MATLPSIGVIGVGTIASATIRGLCSSVTCSVVLSPRNAEKAQQLRDEFPEVVRVANSNDSCDCIVVAVLPSQASILSQLSFPKDVEVVSLMAGLYPQQLRELCGDIPISVVIPYPSIARREGAALLLQPSPVALAMFESLGRCVAVEDEEKFRYLACASGLMGNLYKQQLTVQKWLDPMVLTAISVRHGPGPASLHSLQIVQMQRRTPSASCWKNKPLAVSMKRCGRCWTKMAATALCALP